jgi:hypothetical protein
VGTPLRPLRLGDEKIHEPPEQKSPGDHDEKKRNEVADLRFSLSSADESQNDADENGIEDHGDKMAF